MRADLVTGVVGMLYTAAGRRVSEADVSLWANVLDDICLEPDEARAIATELIRGLDLWERPPTPKLYRDQVMSWRRRNPPSDAGALDDPNPPGPDPEGPMDYRKSRITEARAVLAKTTPARGYEGKRRGTNEPLWTPRGRP